MLIETRFHMRLFGDFTQIEREIYVLVSCVLRISHLFGLFLVSDFSCVVTEVEGLGSTSVT